MRALFSAFPQDRIEWHGEKTLSEIAVLLSRSALYVWPGCGEAYGLAYLEAEAAGVPVVAQAVAGVPEVVEHGSTGLLTPPDDIGAYAEAIAQLLADREKRRTMAAAARHFVVSERSLETAAARLDAILKEHLEHRP